MNLFKKIFLLLMCLTIFSSAEAAKEKPVFVWSHDTYVMSIADDYKNAEKKRSYSLMRAGSKEDQAKRAQQIAEALAAKFKAQASVLPFTLETSMSEDDTADRNSEISDATFGDQSRIQIIPIVIADIQIPQKYTIKGKDYYKYTLISAVDIAFCSEDNNGALTILANIPLHFRTTLPDSKESSSLESMTQRSDEDLARVFTNFTAQRIEEELDFTKYKKLIEGVIDKSLAAETYRVENVTYTSKKCMELLGRNKRGEEVKLMQRICGNIFTSDYAAHTGKVVYPMILPGDTSSWTQDATKKLYAAKITSSHSGEKTITMPEKVDHQITLDVPGVGTQELQTKQVSNINGFKLYKLRLLSTISGKSPIEVEQHIQHEYTKNPDLLSKIEPSEEEIFGALLIGASVKAAAAQAGKKVK